MGMDIYELRRQIVLGLIKDKFSGNKSRFAAAAGISPSYVTRIVSDPGDDPERHKRIGEDMARKLEDVPEMGLRPGQMLDPVGNEQVDAEPSAVIISTSEWGTLQDLRDMTDEDQEFLQREIEARSSRFRALRKRILAEAGIHGSADPASVMKALGSAPMEKAGTDGIAARVTEPTKENVRAMPDTTSGAGPQQGRMLGPDSQLSELGAPEAPQERKARK